MKSIIAIVSDDIFFPHLFLILLKRKIKEVEIIKTSSLLQIDEKLNFKSCDLVLLDGGIINMSSIELIHQIRVQQRIIAPIWFFTEIETESYINKSKEMGVNIVVKKPFDPHTITDDIAVLLLNKF